MILYAEIITSCTSIILWTMDFMSFSTFKIFLLLFLPNTLYVIETYFYPIEVMILNNYIMMLLKMKYNKVSEYCKEPYK